MTEYSHNEVWKGQKVTHTINRFVIQTAAWAEVGLPEGAVWWRLSNQAAANLLDYMVADSEPAAQANVHFRQLAQLGQVPSYVEDESSLVGAMLFVRRNVAAQVVVVETRVPGWQEKR